MNRVFRVILTALLVTSAISITPNILAAFYSGTPSPGLSPVFGVLVNFDDQPTDTPVLWDDYAHLGVASITETEGIGTLMRFAGSQSQPNYVGTGWDFGWNGTILIEFACPAKRVGIGFANNAGGPEFVSVYNKHHELLESNQVPSGANVYVYFARGGYDISYLEIKGNFYAVDDLQFDSKCPIGGEILPNTLLTTPWLLACLSTIALSAGIVLKKKKNI